MIKASKKINYFRSCFEADNRSPQLYSFYSQKVSKPKILSDSDLLNGKLPYLPVGDRWGNESLKILTLYAKEKSLFCCAFFILGNTVVLGKKQKLIAPLLLYPAELTEKDEMHQVTLTSFAPVLNPAAIQPLTLKDPSKNAIDELSAQIADGPLRFDEGVFLKEALDGLFQNLNTETLSEYPRVASPSQMEKLRKSSAFFKSDDQFYLVSAIGLGIINKVKSGRGILNELDEIATYDWKLSRPLDTLINNQATKQKVHNIKNIFVPATLNKAQDQLIKKSHDAKLSIVVGPPGTGKSFTIAALTIDAFCRGESVLIAAKNSQAVEVIAQKLENDFQLDHTPIKTSDKKWKAQVKQYLENILSGMGVEAVSRSNLRKLERKLSYTIKDIDRLENIIQSRTKNEKEWGKLLLKKPLSLWEKFKLKLYKRRAQNVDPLWELYQGLLKELHFKNEQLNQYVAKSHQYCLHEVLSKKRKELQFFLKALRARTGNLKEERFNKVDFNTLFIALPIWLVTMEEVNQVLPLKKELFDLVIFDEATQCNIASALPVLQRGARAVIVGDPKQLRHISFLSNQRQRQLLAQQEIPISELEDLDYRNKSLLDFALDRVDEQQYIHFLNEHYRSLPDLIDFSNRKFYNKALNLMTDTPTAKKNGNLHVHPVEGKRLGRGYNAKEADFVLEKIKTLADQEANFPEALCQSIGVLSPFREQSDRLAKIIGESISLDVLKRHQILIGTPHFFQGEERDIMILSFTLDNQSHPSAFRYLEKSDVFNVSITRARSEQLLLISFDPNHLHSDSLLKEYLSSASKTFEISPEASERQIHDKFMQEVVEMLRELPHDQIYQHYHISGLDIDIVLVHSGKTYCIDLVGYPGNYETAFPIERIKMLDRMHIKVFSLPYLLWTIDKEKCVFALKTFLEIKD